MPSGTQDGAPWPYMGKDIAFSEVAGLAVDTWNYFLRHIVCDQRGPQMRGYPSGVGMQAAGGNMKIISD